MSYPINRIMKKIFTLFILGIIAASCSSEDANVDQYETQNIDKMTEADFIDFMQNIAISRDVLPSELNPEESVYPLPIESITTIGEEKFLIEDPDFGACLVRDINLPGTGTVGHFEVKSFNDSDDDDDDVDTKFDFKYTAAPGWYIASISMNVVSDCNLTPLVNGIPDVCAFNIRNCFNGRRTGVTYRFRDNCLPDCTCLAAYVVMYTLKDNGRIDRCVGVWVDGDQLGLSDTAKSNTFCQDDCGEVQDN
ncbi:hypothetical protein BBFL7_00512 [Flavobacteria bacterium BBFL7]|nr:hypothetical protein BBFL7_00512 [Flavobacteria bacterium BBFL7]